MLNILDVTRAQGPPGPQGPRGPRGFTAQEEHLQQSMTHQGSSESN